MVRTLNADSTSALKKKNQTVSRRKNAGRTSVRAAKSSGGVRDGRISRGRGTRQPQKRRASGKSEGVRVDEANLEAAGSGSRRRTTAMSFHSVVFMLALIAVMTVLLLYYIKLQADVTSTSQEIAELEQELTQIKAENDASYNEITDSISLEEVRRKAIQELGMKYADRDQVVIYSGTEKDTVHQVSSLNEE